MGAFFYVIFWFFTDAFNSLSLLLIFFLLITMCFGVFLFEFILYEILCTYWFWITVSFPRLGSFSAIISCLEPVLPLFSFWCPYSVKKQQKDTAINVYCKTGQQEFMLNRDGKNQENPTYRTKWWKLWAARKNFPYQWVDCTHDTLETMAWNHCPRKQPKQSGLSLYRHWGPGYPLHPASHPYFSVFSFVSYLSISLHYHCYEWLIDNFPYSFPS